MGNPVVDPNHPFWDVMKTAIDRGDGTEAGAGPAINTDTGMDEAGGDGDVEGYSGGGLVDEEPPPRFMNGKRVQPAPHSYYHPALGEDTMRAAQDTAQRETALKVNSNESRAVNGYADGGYVEVSHADDTTRPSISSAFGLGMSAGHDVREANLGQTGRDAQELSATTAGIDPHDTDAPAAPAADRPGLLGKVGHTIMHPIQAVRQAVTDVADFLGHPDNNAKTADKGVPTDEAPAPAAPATGGAIPATGDAAGAAPQPAGAAPAAGAPPASPEQAVVKAGAAAADQPVPTNIQEAAAQAKADPNATTKPYSTTPDYYHKIQQGATKAAVLAAKAGLDPKLVYDNTMAMAVSHIQGQVMRSYGAAYNAFQEGKMDKVEQALRDANFYLPDGKDLKFQRATQADVSAKRAGVVGDLMVRNPFLGMPGHEKDSEWVPINPQQISLMATAALHPENFHTEMQSVVKAQTEAMKDAAEAQARIDSGQGSLKRGEASFQRAQNDKLRVNSDNYYKQALGKAALIKANRGPSSGQPKISVSAASALQEKARKAVENAALGPSIVGKDTMTVDGKQVPNIAGTAGKVVHDPTNVRPLFKGLEPQALSDISVMASHYASGNGIAGPNNTPAVTPDEAADIAATVYRWEHGLTYNEQTNQSIPGGPPRGGKHVRPGTGTPANPKKEFDVDVVRDPGKGYLHVWMKDHWVDLYENQNIDDRAPAVDTDPDAPAVNTADNEPAVDPTDAAYDAKSDAGE